MKIGSFHIDIKSPAGLIIMAVGVVVALFLAWWLLGAILSLTLGHVLLLIAAGGVGYVIGRGRR